MPPVIVAAIGGAAMAAGTAAAAGTFFTAATITAMATSAAISAALAGAAMVLSPKAKPFNQEAKDRMVSVRQAIAPRQRIYGEVRTGGPIVFLQSTSDHTGANKNKWLHLVIPLAGHQVEDITDVYFDDELLPLGADGYVTSGKFFYKGDLGGHWQSTWQRSMVYVKKYLGAPGQTADPTLVGAFGSKWTANHIGVGIAYLYCRLEFNRDIFTGGIPNVTAIVKGARVYDPRDGQTKWSSNAALCIMDYLKLPIQAGGIGAPADEFDNTHWASQANICDELVPAGDGQERRYTINGTISMSSANTPRNQLESMLTAMSGGIVYAGGKWRCLPAVYRAPVVTLTEDDLRSTLQVQTRISRRDTFNCVKGSYTSKENNYQPADYPSLISDTGIAEDGGEPIWRELDRPFTNSGYACQRLAKIDYLKTRQPISLTAPCKLTAFRVQAGDVVNITNKRFGWTAKPFEVVEWAFRVTTEGELGCDLGLRETHASIYDWNTSEEQSVDPAPGTDLPDWRSVAPPRDVDVESSNALVVEGTDGSLISRALVTWTASLDGFVDTYRVQWRLSNTVDWLNTGETQALFFSIDNMPVGVIIDVRVQAVNALGIGSDWITIFAHQISGFSDRANPAVTGLKVQGSAVGSPGVWNHLDATIVWDATAIGGLFDCYVIEVRTTAGNALRRTVETKDAMYVYDYSANAVDGLSRAITFVVRVRTKIVGATNRLSLPATLAATNPAPPVPTAISLIGAFNAVSLRFVRPPDQDWQGTLVWRSTTSGFVRNSSSQVYDGPDTDIFTASSPGTTYYYRIAAFDAFGKVGLNESGEIAVTTARVSHADLATEIIDSSNLIPALNTEIAKIAVQGTAITTEQTLREQGDQQLAQQITTISAAATVGFNPAAQWSFDTGNDGWTAANAAIAWQSSGAIRVTPSTSDPQIISPTISIKGALNRFVRIKITRVSGSGSVGNQQVYFTTSGHSYSESHTKTIPIGTIAIGESKVLSFDMAGAGDWSTSTITRIRFDPINSAVDVFDVDFIAIGSEGPSLGTAVFEERLKTVVDANTATAESLTTLQTTVGTNTSSIQTQQTSIGGLEAQWTVKTDVNQYVSGFGLATTVKDGTPTSSFIVSADRFAVAKPGTGGLGPTIPFIIKTIGSTPQLSFTGWARFDQLESGTIDTQIAYVGGTNVVIDGPSKRISVNSGGVDLVRMGQVTSGVYGVEIKDSTGALIMSSGAGLGAGALVSSANMKTGRGVNLLYNSDFQFSLDGWTVMDNTTGQTLAIGRNVNTSNTITGLGLAYISAPGTPANGAVMVLANWNITGGRYPVVPNRRYEASALLGQYRSAGAHLMISFYDANGAWITNHISTPAVTNTTQFIRLNQLGSALVFATAPSTAVSAMVRLIVYCNGTGANPYGMITQAYFGEAGANQTEASPWVPGPTQLSVGGVSGLGSLATLNSVTTAQVTGLGTLATASSVPVNLVSGLGSFATASQITQANASTYIAAAALGSAHINNLTVDKLWSGALRSDTYLQAGNNVFIDGSTSGRIYITDPRVAVSPPRLRVYAGHMPGVDYGFWLWNNAGEEIFGSSGLTGTYIKDLTVTNGKFANLTIGGEKIQDLAASNSVGGTSPSSTSFGVGMNVLGNRSITVIAVIRFALTGRTAESNNTAAQAFNDRVDFQIVSNGASLTGMVPAGTIYGSNWAGTASLMHTFTPGGAPHSRNFFIQASRAVQCNIWAIENRK